MLLPHRRFNKWRKNAENKPPLDRHSQESLVSNEIREEGFSPASENLTNIDQ